jgi:hypothetical protein
MPTYEITGVGHETGRERHRKYMAFDEAQARAQAEEDGTDVISVLELPPTPPTEDQLAYAYDLGISVPPDADKEEVSDLISARLSGDDPAAPVFQLFAQRWGAQYTRYTGEKALFNRVFWRLCKPGEEEDLSAWFVFRVFRYLLGLTDAGEIRGPDDPVIRYIAEQLTLDEKVIKSIQRHQGYELIWFGKWTSSNGTVTTGGSQSTVAFKAASGYLQQYLPLELTLSRGPRSRPHVERTASPQADTINW